VKQSCTPSTSPGKNTPSNGWTTRGEESHSRRRDIDKYSVKKQKCVGADTEGRPVLAPSLLQLPSPLFLFRDVPLFLPPCLIVSRFLPFLIE